MEYKFSFTNPLPLDASIYNLETREFIVHGMPIDEQMVILIGKYPETLYKEAFTRWISKYFNFIMRRFNETL